MNRNPVLNSPDDINDKLLLQISRNELDSLTINYEFTTKFDNREDWEDYKKEQIRINPFWRASRIKPIKRIEFEIRLGKNVHSLAGAFMKFKKYEIKTYSSSRGFTMIPIKIAWAAEKISPHIIMIDKNRLS